MRGETFEYRFVCFFNKYLLSSFDDLLFSYFVDFGDRVVIFICGVLIRG